jgi:hypothetical protein
MKAKHIVLVIVSLFICLGLFAQAADQAAAAELPPLREEPTSFPCS